MSEQKLRALLAEARMYLTMNGGSVDDRIVRSIDAALAEPVLAPPTNYYAEFDAMRDKAAKYGLEATQMRKERDEARALLQDLAAACRGLKPLSDEASTVVGPVFRQREEAWAEVGRLTRELEEVHRARVGVERAAYRRGAEAMREEIAIRVDGEGINVGSHFGCIIRALPIPEDEP